MNEIDWQDLRLLLSFSEGGTLQEAAKIHGITPSTVSRRIRSLEERVGVRLVENVSGHLVVTPQGDDALTAARAMKDHS
ncbi:MAG: LysR family transcriptional regulator, partial [Myxococcota bacterium]